MYLAQVTFADRPRPPVDECAAVVLLGRFFVLGQTNAESVASLGMLLADYPRLLAAMFLEAPVRLALLTVLDALVQQVDLSGCPDAVAQRHGVFTLASHLEAVWHVLELWLADPRRAQLGRELEHCALRVMATVLARSTKAFYGSKIEPFVVRRLLKAALTERTRDGAVQCLLRVFRGPRFRELGSLFGYPIDTALPSVGEEHRVCRGYGMFRRCGSVAAG